ncbi:leucine-rich repeat domain-containing protein [Blautia sp.]|uniref:leucine-rich repeat domain-containing protein n=1 Tax=Blautia sp. TaxID=1955243 RepID=UPI002587C82C|nr:leucine-rich repeat domain-containing protein [Blautia sp.]
MKKKQIAVLLAALLSVSPAVEGVAVMGADFSSGEEAVEAMQEQTETEDSAAENVATETEEAENAGITEDIWTSGEEISEFETGEEEQQDMFVEEPDAQTESATAAQGTGTYEVAFIDAGQFNTCLRTDEDRPNVEMQTIEKTTLTEALKSMEGDNTGYCLVIPHELEGEEDIVVPEGMNVFVGYGDGDVKIRSITPNGNITFWGVGNDKESIEIKEGKGTVAFKQLYMNGEIRGTGSDDTVIFHEDATIGGISGIENVHFDCWNLNIKGKSEFYNLYNDTGHDEENVPAWIQIEGYSKEKVPVFHKGFDWGTGTFKNEEGDSWSDNYMLGIGYVKSFEGGEWEEMKLSSGSQAVTFDMPLEDIVKLSDRLYISQESYDPELSLDGKIWDRNENKLYRIYRYQDAGGFTAQEIFENHGIWDFEYPDNADYFLGSTSDVNQMMQVIESDQKNQSVGYYTIDLPKDASVDTIDIPSGVKGVSFWGPSDYDEKTDTHTQYPIKKIGSVKTKEGQTVKLAHAIVDSGLSVSGDGIVQIQDSVIQGTLKGTGANDTVTFIQDSQLGGLSGVENVHFGKQCGSLNLRGAAEFYNIYNDTGSDANEQFPVGLQIEGADASKTVTFHKTFDWGIGDFSDENGNHWTEPYTLAIRYFKTFDTNGEDWEMINPGVGFQSVRFDMPDTDIIDMLSRVQVHVPDYGYVLDMDGKTCSQEQDESVGIEECHSTEKLSAQELFDAYGKREVSEEDFSSISWLGALPSTGQASRYLAAYQKKNNAEGYYIVHIGQKAEITGTLTVPDGVNAVKYAGSVQHDEKTDTNRWVPIKLSSVNVPAGKKVVLMNMLVKSDNLAITGEGTTELLDTRLNTNVTANTLEITKAAVKNLNCKKLLMESEEEGGNKLVVAGYLSFEKASLNPNCELYAEPGSYLKLGEIDCTKFDVRDNLHIFTGKNGSLSAEVYFAGELNLGTYMHTLGDGSERDLERGMNLITCDEQRAGKANACFIEDCFSETYHYNEDGKSWWGDYPVVYKNEKICLATVDKKLDEKNILEFMSVEFALPDKKESSIILSVPEKENGEWEDYAIDGDKRLVSYWRNENDEWKQIKTKAYFRTAETSASSIASAQISDIKTQIYAGKAVTPSVTVTLNGKKLKKGTDYTVSYANNTKAGSEASVIIKGKGKYVGTTTKDFEIAAIPAKGKVYTAGNLKYKVTKSAYKNGTVSVYAPAKKTLTSVSIPATVKINGYTFQVTAIGNKAFAKCTKLKSVKIGTKVTTIGKEAFSGCKALTSITISSNVLKAVGSSAFKGISAKAVIKVPAAKLSAYQKLLKGKGQKSSVKITK